MRLLLHRARARRATRPPGLRQPLTVSALLLALPTALLTAVALGGLSVGGAAAAAEQTRIRPDVVGQILVERPSPVLDRPVLLAASRGAHRHSLLRPAHRWVLPYPGVLTSPFGARWGGFHPGIDLAGPYGTPIVAATDGVITYAGPMSGYGEVMMIQDWDGTETVYGHMSAFVRTSGAVRAGEVIALIGAAGDATGPHLHFEVRVNGVVVDPAAFLAARGVSV